MRSGGQCTAVHYCGMLHTVDAHGARLVSSTASPRVTALPCSVGNLSKFSRIFWLSRTAMPALHIFLLRNCVLHRMTVLEAPLALKHVRRPPQMHLRITQVVRTRIMTSQLCPEWAYHARWWMYWCLLLTWAFMILRITLVREGTRWAT